MTFRFTSLTAGLTKRCTGMIFILATLSSAAYSQEPFSAATCIQASEALVNLAAADEVFTFDVSQCHSQEQLTAGLQEELLKRWQGDLEGFAIDAGDFETALAVLGTDDSRADGTAAYSSAALQKVQDFYQSDKADAKVLIGTLTYNAFGGTGVKALVVLYTSGHDKVVLLTKQKYSE